MLELYIIRHGLAGDRLEDEAMDQERPLIKKGKQRLKSIAKFLKSNDVSFDAVVASPLERSAETAEIINKSCGTSDVLYTDFLKPEASYQKLTRFLNKLDAERVAIVGHEPFLSGYASACLTGNDESFIQLKKGGVLALEINKTIKPGKCKLVWLMKPCQMI